MTREFGGQVEFRVPREVAFDYLVDPRHRPEWQWSLARVSAIDGEPRIGQTWVDETRLAIRPLMRTTELDRPRLWSESGTWRFVRADLTLRFDDAPVGCTVDHRFRIHVLGPVGLALSALSVRAVGADLRSAARLLASRG